jgi:hypothetical protein
VRSSEPSHPRNAPTTLKTPDTRKPDIITL